MKSIMAHSLKIKDQYCFPLYALSREITQLYRPLLTTLDLTYPQYLVLLVLWEESIQTVNQLGEKLHLDSGTLTPLLKRLEQKQLIQRRRSERDERVVEVSLTAEGKALEQQASCIPTQLMENLDVDAADLQAIKRLADKIFKKNKE